MSKCPQRLMRLMRLMSSKCPERIACWVIRWCRRFMDLRSWKDRVFLLKWRCGTSELTEVLGHIYIYMYICICIYIYMYIYVYIYKLCSSWDWTSGYRIVSNMAIWSCGYTFHFAYGCEPDGCRLIGWRMDQSIQRVSFTTNSYPLVL